jgi:hypothetical protein
MSIPDPDLDFLVPGGLFSVIVLRETQHCRRSFICDQKHASEGMLPAAMGHIQCETAAGDDVRAAAPSQQLKERICCEDTVVK